MSPDGVIRPRKVWTPPRICRAEKYQRFPSGPLAMLGLAPNGRSGNGNGNAVTSPDGLMRPIAGEKPENRDCRRGRSRSRTARRDQAVARTL